jgi:hypothetical protein
MKRARRSTFLSGRMFKSSKPAVDDIDELTAVEKSFRNSSFALLPSAVTPSRAPSNTLVASCQAAFFEAPVRFHIPYGRDKWPELFDWYGHCGSKGSTAIGKIQLRKNHQHPYYHEYIVVFTRGGYIYRIDRRPDADAAFDTMMKEGCTAYDTVEELDPTALKELEGSFDCVAELRWRGEQTIDLLFVLSICFKIHNDRWTKRYTLQHYNCYFLSWMIVMIIVRSTTALRAGSNAALERGEWPTGLRNWSGERQHERARERERQRERQRGLERGLERGRAQVRARVQALVRGLALEPGGRQELERALVRERALERAWAQAREQGRKLEQELEREWDQDQDQDRKIAQALAPVLTQVPLVLGWQLAQGWKHRGEDVREKLQKLLQDVDTGSLPGSDPSAKTSPNRRGDHAEIIVFWLTYAFIGRIKMSARS